MDSHRVVIAGAGVGGLEALLALDELAPGLSAVQLLAPGDEYVQRAQLVAMPFGGPEPVRLSLAELAAETGAEHVRGALDRVDAGARTVTTTAGRTMPFDSLLIGVGAIADQAVAGALTFPEPGEGGGFERLLERLGRRGTQRIVFAVAPGIEWSLPAYELALLTASECAARKIQGVEILLVTHEPEPLRAAGEQVGELLRGRLAEAGVELMTAARAVGFAGGELELDGACSIAADAVVALPRLRGPAVEGLPHNPHGFLPVDVQMHVAGLEGVWAVGDATDQPVKQGGLAAQQAEIAARGIAIRAGAHAPYRSFDPVLRAAIVTGGPVEYIRRPMSAGAQAVGSTGRTLWWPPAKVAGERLAARLSLPAVAARQALLDVADSTSAAIPERAPDAPAELLLAAADADAEVGDYAGALGWLELVERLDFIIPADHLARRAEWERLAGSPAEASAAAMRLDPSLGNADAALSDVRRRVGWLREVGRRSGGEMAAQLDRLSNDLDHVVALSKKTGVQ